MTKNLTKIESIRPHDWKVKLREQLLSFFDSIHLKVDLIKNFQLKHLHAIIGSLNLDTLSTEVKSLQASSDVLAKHSEYLTA